MGYKIIIALDSVVVGKALKIARLLSGKVWGFKFNDLLHDSKFNIKYFKKYGRVFADVKLHDIPNTVTNSVRQLSRQGADIITVHASGGIKMMKSAVTSAGRSKIVAVTVLTSIGGNPKKEVLKLVGDAQKAGVYGVVCSGHELKFLKKSKLMKIVPGIRPEKYRKKDDQKRTITPQRAVAFGADFLVIGRPITGAKDPKEALSRLWS